MSKERKNIDLKGRVGIFDNSPIPQQTPQQKDEPQFSNEMDSKEETNKSITLKKPEKIESSEEDVPKQKAINIRISPSFHEEYKVYCIKKGQTIQDYTVSLIKKDMKKNK